MRFSVGVKFCKAFISKNYALDSLESCELSLQNMADSCESTPPARGGAYNDSPSLARGDFTDFPSLADGARGWVKSLATLKKDLDLSFIPVIERRRLSEASKITLGLLGDSPLIMPIVFSSQKGEINRCFGMLNDLALHHFTSPTAFSLSVLNATPALLAIAQKNHSEILAISAVDCFEYGLMNAYALLCESAQDSCESTHPLSPSARAGESMDLRESNPKECLVISYEEKLESKEISAVIACVSLDSTLPQIVIKKRESHKIEADSHESNAKCANLGSNLSFLSAVAGKTLRYENGDFALDISDFLQGFSIEKL